MNIIANNIASKLFVGFVAVAMLFMLSTPAKAATAEELQQMINDLLKQVASLQAQVGQGGQSTSSGVCPFTWTRSLSTGASGADVMKLQQFLNADVDTRIAASGVGSVGMETQYFGGLTAAAVSKFQMKYRSEVLSPAGLVNPTGYFGPASMAKANAICNSAPAGDDTTGDDTSDDTAGDDDDDSSSDLSGEASLDKFEIASGDDDEIDEGQEDAPVAEVTVEFADGDAKITRLDVSLVGSGDEQDPWDTFETVSLWVDGDMVAEEDASDQDNYLDDDAGTMRFTGLDLVANEDEEMDITIAVTVQNSVDGTNNGEAWTVSADSMRYVDGDDVTTTDDSTGDLGDTVAFTVNEAGSDDELIVKSSTEDPTGATLAVKDDAKSDWYTIFAFDLDTDDSGNDITLKKVPVTLNFSSSTYNALVDDVELVIDGVTIDDVSTTTGGATASAVVTFNVGSDVSIDAGDRVTAELNVRFKSLALGNEGVMASGTVTTANADAIDAEGADDLGDSQTSGSASGDDFTLRTSGITVEPGDMTATVTNGDSATDDYAVYTIEMDVTAFEQDVHIDTNPATSINYTLEDGSGSSSVAGTRTVTLTSTGDEESGYFVVHEGDTETLTLEVTYTPGVAGTASRLQLDSIEFAETGVAPTQTWTASPANDYRTAVKTMVN